MEGIHSVNKTTLQILVINFLSSFRSAGFHGVYFTFGHFCPGRSSVEQSISQEGQVFCFLSFKTKAMSWYLVERVFNSILESPARSLTNIILGPLSFFHTGDLHCSASFQMLSSDQSMQGMCSHNHLMPNTRVYCTSGATIKNQGFQCSPIPIGTFSIFESHAFLPIGVLSICSNVTVSLRGLVANPIPRIRLIKSQLHSEYNNTRIFI